MTNKYSDPADSIMEFECQSCKNVFWTPHYDDFTEFGYPCYCCYCGLPIDYILFEEGE